MNLAENPKIPEAETIACDFARFTEHVFFAVNAQDRLAFISHSVERVLGYHPNDLVGKRWQDLSVRFQTQPLSQPISTAGELPGTMTLDIPAANGEVRVMRFEYAARGRAGDLGWGIAKDISGEASIRLQMLHRIAALESLVVQSLGDSPAKEFAQTVVHELNQPLTAIVNLGAALALQFGKDDVPQDRILATIGDMTEAAHLAADILRGFVREEPLSATELSVCNLGELVSDSLRMHHRELGNLRVQLVVRSPGDVLVRACEAQIQQVLGNLLRNAIQACSEAGKIEIVVQTAEELAHVMVRDDGHGVGDATKSNLFSVHPSSKPGGMGIGLCVCKQIVEALGGFIWHCDGPSTGAEFHFKIPLAT